jgi:autotransporter-associated beta strand protein
LVVGSATEVRAGDPYLYWDINGTAAGATNGTTANGSWSNNSWSTDPGGTVPTIFWIPGLNANFSAGSNATGASQVVLHDPVSVSKISFEEGTVDIAGPQQLTLIGGEVNVASGLTAKITAPLGGSVGLHKVGPGTLTLGGVGTFAYSGDTIVSGGTLKLDGGTINNTGVIVAEDGAILELGVTSTSGHLIGGHLATVGSGVINVTNTYKFQDVTFDTDSQIQTYDGMTLRFVNTISNYTSLEIRNSFSAPVQR